MVILNKKLIFLKTEKWQQMGGCKKNIKYGENDSFRLSQISKHFWDKCRPYFRNIYTHSDAEMSLVEKKKKR